MNEYRDTHASILRFCRDFADEMRGQGYDIEVIDMDTAGEPGVWPKKDVIGPAEFNFTLNDGLIEVECAIGVSTLEDTNLFRMRDQLNRVLNKLIPGMRIKLLNASTGQTRGLLVVRNGTQVAAPFQSNTRAVQGIMVSFISDQTLRG
jgi:hypothetical protein